MSIQWDNIQLLPNPYKNGEYNLSQVKTVCNVCGLERWQVISTVRKQIKQSGFDGNCNQCAQRLRPSYKGGTWIKYDGYINCRRNHFTEKELTILNPMWPANNNYVRRNRAVMALHLGRPLAKDEIVHHKNGKRSDDGIENLELLRRSTHHNGHGDNYYQKWQEALQEIKRLQHKLTFHASAKNNST